MNSKKWINVRFVVAALAIVGAVTMWTFEAAKPAVDAGIAETTGEAGNEVLLATNPDSDSDITPEQSGSEEVNLSQSIPTGAVEAAEENPFAREFLGNMQKQPEAMQLYGEIMEYLDSEEGETAAIDMIETLGEGDGELDQAFLEKAIPNPAIRAKWNRLLELVIADQGLPTDEN